MPSNTSVAQRFRRAFGASWQPLLVLLACLVVAWTDTLRMASSRHSVIVIALDGVRWHEIFIGCEPELTRHRRCPGDVPAPAVRRMFTTEGAALGAPGRSEFGVTGPTYLSMPGYQQLFTGVRRVDCASNECGRVSRRTISDAVAERFGPAQAVVFSSWPGVGEAAARDPSKARISAGRSPDGSYRDDGETARLALELAERELPRFLFVGLGDTDEAAHTGDYDAYLEALSRADQWVGRFADLARRRNARGLATTLLVTTDHGRATDAKEHEQVPEAARIWLTASGPEIRARGRLVARRRELADLAPTVARLLQIPFPGAEGRVLDELFRRENAEHEPLTLALDRH